MIDQEQQQCVGCPSEKLLDGGCLALLQNGICRLYGPAHSTIPEIKTHPKTGFERIKNLKPIEVLEINPDIL